MGVSGVVMLGGHAQTVVMAMELQACAAPRSDGLRRFEIDAVSWMMGQKGDAVDPTPTLRAQRRLVKGCRHRFAVPFATCDG